MKKNNVHLLKLTSIFFFSMVSLTACLSGRTHVHHFIEEAVEPTCIEKGYTLYHCDSCEESYMDNFTDPVEHKWYTIPVKHVDSTCTTEGCNTYKCSVCGTTKDVKLDPTGHNYQVEVISPTCISQGYSLNTCLNCGDTYKNDYIPATGHTYEINVVEPTCTTRGYTEHKCNKCKEKYVDSYIEPLGHSWNEGSVEKDATCTEDGSLIYECTRCHEIRHETTLSHGHNFEGTVFEPTCLDKGFTAYSCKECKYYYEDNYVEPLGHLWSDEYYESEPTCSGKGVKACICNRCGLKKTQDVDAKGHNYFETVVEPTCLNEGYTRHFCTNCDLDYKDNYTSPLGHSWDNGTFLNNASCTVSGEKQYKCIRCEETRIETVEATGHHYESTIVEPTCNTDGYTIHNCTGCNDSYIDTYVSSLGHDWDNGTYELNATCTERGEYVYRCSRCTETKTQYIDATGHNYLQTVVEPTCTQDGYTVHHCEYCNDVYYSAYTMALGHDWDVGEIENYPTCEQNGNKLFTCTRCSETMRETMDASGHSMLQGRIDPTCTERGYYRSYCSQCNYEVIQNYIEPLGHTWDSGIVIDEPGNPNNGGIKYTCTRCGEIKEITDCESGHDFEEIITPAWCTQSGKYEKKCRICNYVYDVQIIEPLGHDWDEGTVIIEPLCRINGEKRFTCLRCGETKIESMGLGDHHYRATEVIAPTCEQDGYTIYKCGDCYITKFDDYIPALGHDWNDGGIMYPLPDGMGPMDVTYTCNRCGITRTETIGNTCAHQMTITTIEPTCLNEGMTVEQCSLCGYTNAYPSGAPLGHDWGDAYIDPNYTDQPSGGLCYKCNRCGATTLQIDGMCVEHELNTSIIEPTCYSEGFATEQCMNCPYTNSYSFGSPLGHCFVEVQRIINSTCDLGGELIYSCTRCGEIYSELQESFEHIFTTQVVPPTDTERGYTIYSCEYCTYSYVDNFVDALGV